MADNIDINASVARSLTSERLADDLNRLADDIRFLAPDERAARIREAANRLTKPHMPQTIVTLADGQQVSWMHGAWRTRSGLAGTWTSPLEESPTQAHVPQTFYVGEW